MNKTMNHFILVMSVVFLVIGGILLFVPQVGAIHLVYVMCGIIVASGIYAIVHYFMTDAYKEAYDYGFSIGVFLCMIGVIGFIKSKDVVHFLPVVISICALLFGVVIFQDALDLKRMKRQWWVMELSVAAAVMLTATTVLIDPFTEEGLKQTVSNALLFADGMVMLFSKFLLRQSIKAYEKEQSRSLDTGEDYTLIEAGPGDYEEVD